MNDITDSGVRDIARQISEGKISTTETTAAFVAKARKHSDINAFVRLFDTPAAAVGAGNLCGVPIAHKDIFCERGVLSTCGSRILENFVAPYDATVIEKSRAAGMVSIGRTNMDEFAMGSSGEHSVYAPSKNPWDTARVPGGSSSGSAAAVAARLCPVATGTDTGGSIRLPASFCGVTGIKPTYGRVSRWGMTAFASGFDQGGIIAKSADDCALVLSAIAGYDERDSTSLDEPTEDYCRLFDNFTPLTIGVPRQFFDDGLHNGVATRVQEALAQMEKLGAKIVDVDLPSVRYAIPAYYVLTSAEASSNLSRYDGVRYGHRAENVDDLQEQYKKTRAEGFGAEVKRRVMVGAYVLSYGYKDAYYRRAMRVRRLIADDFTRAFQHCDIIAGPTAPGVAFLLGELSSGDPVKMYLQDIYTVPVNLAGLPALSAPCGFIGNLPVGLQLIGSPLTEARLLAAADGYQKHTDWHLRAPTLT